MSKKSSKFTITEKDLATALEISPEKLEEIINFFDSDFIDEWELRENDHFIYINKKWKERLFSQHGDFAIAKYMDTIEKKNFWERIVEFITKHKERLRHAFIRQRILDNSSSLTLKNNQHFLSKKEAVNILATSHARFNVAFKDLQASETPLEIYKDFDDFEGIRYYSLGGFYKLTRELAIKLKERDRREWCTAVEIVGKKTFQLLIDEETAKEKRIKAAMDAAKRRDKFCCQITGLNPTKHNRINMAVHHIFSKKHYPHLATSSDNLITLTEDVHQKFHHWNGGFDKPCTVDDLIRFVNEQYPENSEVSLKLHQIKQIFK